MALDEPRRCSWIIFGMIVENGIVPGTWTRLVVLKAQVKGLSRRTMEYHQPPHSKRPKGPAAVGTAPATEKSVSSAANAQMPPAPKIKQAVADPSAVRTDGAGTPAPSPEEDLMSWCLRSRGQSGCSRFRFSGKHPERKPCPLRRGPAGPDSSASGRRSIGLGFMEKRRSMPGSSATSSGMG